MEKFFTENRELIKIAIVVLSMLVVGIVIVVLLMRISDRHLGVYYDEYSGQEISSVGTGGGYGGPNVETIGFGLLLDYEPTVSDVVFGATTKIRDFVNFIYPEVSNISLVRKSIEKNDNVFLFKIHLDNGVEFLCELTDYGNGLYALKINDENNVILDYDGARIFPYSRNYKILAKKYLPYTIRRDDLTITVIEEDGKHKILVSSCGNERIKVSAHGIVNDWLKVLNFNPGDFNFEMPTYCDGEAE